MLDMTRPSPPPLSILERIEENPDRHGNGTVIGLHDADARLSEAMPLFRNMVRGKRLIVPRSARWSGYGDGGRYSWFSSMSPPLVEPIGFGDSLIQLEALALEYATGAERPDTVLLGMGQGGSIALCLAALWPELFKGVVAVNALWPDVADWQPPEQDMAAVQVLLIAPQGDAGSRLAARGAQIEVIRTAVVGLALNDICGRWISDVIGREA